MRYHCSRKFIGNKKKTHWGKSELAYQEQFLQNPKCFLLTLWSVMQIVREIINIIFVPLLKKNKKTVGRKGNCSPRAISSFPSLFFMSV